MSDIKQKFIQNIWVLMLSLMVFICIQNEAREVFLEGKASYYLSTNDRFRDLYGGAGLYRVEANIQVGNSWFVWTNLGYLYASGNTNQGSHSHLHLVPLAAGASFLFKSELFAPYVGGGPLIAYSYINNRSCYVTRYQNGWGGGFLVKAGALAYITSKAYFDFFLDYSFIRMSFHHGGQRTIHHKADLSGFSFGAGFGYKF